MVLIDEGFHVPVIPGLFVETPGSTGGIEFIHKGPIGLKVGTSEVTTSMATVVLVAHFPGSGVKV